MNIQTINKCDQRAREILQKNDRGNYTVPTDGLYPFQWNWDSALVALGFSAFDPDRAWREIETLLSAQWDNGMVPHIIFWKDDEGYFPGPAEWGTGTSPKTSGITQPPLAATIVRELLDRAGQNMHQRAVPIIIALNRWHQWFSDARDPDGRGLVTIIHPWESGRDNLPDWDKPLARVDTSGVGTYSRRDTQHVHEDERPKKLDYDRYMALVQFGRQNGWDPEIIARDNPFWVADVGMNAILRRAEHDLVHLAETLGLNRVAAEARARAQRLDAGFEALWSEQLGGYVSLDLRHNERAQTLTAGTFLAFYASNTPDLHARRMLDTFHLWSARVRYGVPSFDPTSELFDSIRYWRGPVWAIINWMIANGLERNGYEKLATRIHKDTQSLICNEGFYEYFCPLTGRGMGGEAFSWTAAAWLAWASPNAPRSERSLEEKPKNSGV